MRRRPVKILLAPNALKGSLTAGEAAAAMAEGVRQACREVGTTRKTVRGLQLPVSDGGDGLIEVLQRVLGGETRRVTVHGPLAETGRTVEAPVLWFGQRRLAVIEIATASGLTRIPRPRRDPSRATTLGTGELLAAALDLGARHVAVGLGGSATVDGGIGAAAALGARFLDRHGRPVEPVGGSLGQIRRIDLSGLDPRLRENGRTGGEPLRIEALCDVTNPLLGPEGAARVYGPQKGATPEQVEALEAGLANLVERIREDVDEELGEALPTLPGAGAAGGLGVGLRAFLGSELVPGAERVLDWIGFDEHLRDADLVLTAEGRLDEPTVRYGKAPAVVARRAREAGVPCFVFAGRSSLPDSTEPFTRIYRLTAPEHSGRDGDSAARGRVSAREREPDLERAHMERAGELLTAATARAVGNFLEDPTR
jgi:glycerate kinase